MKIVASFCIIAGIFFFFTGVIGILRFPDFFSRMHATGKGDTLGTVLVLTGVALYNLDGGCTVANVLVSIKLMLIGVFWVIANPTATHALLRAAFDSGLMPWIKHGEPVIDWPPRPGEEE